jgi:hypothetical protein
MQDDALRRKACQCLQLGHDGLADRTACLVAVGLAGNADHVDVPGSDTARAGAAVGKCN